MGHILKVGTKVCWHIRCGVLEEWQLGLLQAKELLLARLEGLWKVGEFGFGHNIFDMSVGHPSDETGIWIYESEDQERGLDLSFEIILM